MQAPKRMLLALQLQLLVLPLLVLQLVPLLVLPLVLPVVLPLLGLEPSSYHDHRPLSTVDSPWQGNSDSDEHI